MWLRQDLAKIKQIYKLFLKSEKINIFMYSILYGICNGTELLIPILIGKIMDYALEKNIVFVLKIMFLTLCLFINITIMSYCRQRVCSNLINKISKKMKCALIEKVVTLPMDKIDKIKVGEILSRLEDCEKIIAFFISFTNNVLLNVIILIITVIFMWKTSPLLTLVQIICTPIVLITYNVFGKKIKQKEKNLIQSQDDLYNFLVELLRGIKEIKALGNVEKILRLHENIHMTLIGRRKASEKESARFGSINILLSGILQLGFLFFVCIEIINQNITVGMYYAFNAYANRFSNLLSAIAEIVMQLNIIIVSVDRILEYTNSISEAYLNCMTSISQEISEIKIENVSFRYGNMCQDVLNNISLVFSRNYLNVIVGSNGCGKSTLLDIIMNFYEPKNGKVFINKIDVKYIDEKDFFKKVVYIRQNTFFFDLSIKENMQLVGDEITIIDIEEVCSKVGLHSVIMKLPEKYETKLGEVGQCFSGGQLQRLALARGILKKADVFILDEITSDLDGESERIVLNILQELYMNKKLVIMVAHRLSTVILANNIIVMSNGQVVAKGRHDYLIKYCEYYRQLFAKQWEDYRGAMCNDTISEETCTKRN